jgi:hypothetical protein
MVNRDKSSVESQHSIPEGQISILYQFKTQILNLYLVFKIFQNYTPASYLLAAQSWLPNPISPWPLFLTVTMTSLQKEKNCKQVLRLATRRLGGQTPDRHEGWRPVQCETPPTPLEASNPPPPTHCYISSSGHFA